MSAPAAAGVSVAATINPDRAMNIFDSCARLGQALDVGVIETQEIYESGVCQGFIQGRHDAPVWKRICAPQAYRVTDIVRIFNAFVEKEPRWRTGDPIDAFDAALESVFRCATDSPADSPR